MTGDFRFRCFLLDAPRERPVISFWNSCPRISSFPGGESDVLGAARLNEWVPVRSKLETGVSSHCVHAISLEAFLWCHDLSLFLRDLRPWRLLKAAFFTRKWLYICDYESIGIWAICRHNIVREWERNICQSNNLSETCALIIKNVTSA